MNTELKLSADLFEPLVNSTVTVVFATHEESWKLSKVERRTSHALRDQPFNLYFAAPVTPENRAQGLRRARLQNGDEFEFFAVPIAASATEISLEVIFN